MNILFIGHERDINGASKSLLNIISRLENKNNIYVLTAYSSGEFLDELKNHNVKVIIKKFYHWKAYKGSLKYWHEEKIKYFLWHKFVNIFTAKQLSKLIKKEKIDIIHSNTGVINIGGLISKYSGCPHVWHIREFGDLDFNMYPIINQKKYIRFMNAYTTKFLMISKAVFNHYEFLDINKKRLVYNGVDSSYYNGKKEYHKDSLVFLIAGRVSKEKGQFEAISAAEILVNNGITNFQLIIAGLQVDKLNIPLKLKKQVQYIGTVKDMVELRKRVDVELVCSTAEAFGRVTIEAMFGAIPVIGSNTGGTTELINSGSNGFLYEKGNPKDLAKKMMYFIKNPFQLKKMGENAQKFALGNFKIERCVSEIEKIYLDILIKG